MTIEVFDLWLLGGALVALLAVVAGRVTVPLGLPSLLAYLAIGLALGEAGFGVKFDDARLAHVLAFAALIVILAEGGLTTPWSAIRTAMPVGVALATLGVAVSVAVVGVVAHYALDFDWRSAFLLGAVVSSTDAAAVFSVLRKVPVPAKLRGVLEVESGLNDASTVLLVTMLSAAQIAEQPLSFLGSVVWSLLAGSGFGLLVGWAGAALLRRAALPSSGLYPLAVLGLIALAYAGAHPLHASGFAAAYLAALVLGNARLPHRRSIISFAEGLAWIAQIGLFVMLGLLAWPDRISWNAVWVALVTAVVVTLAARPLSVLASALPFKLRPRDHAFLSWAGLRGALPIVLVTIPLAAELPGAARLFDVVFVLVVVLTLAQGPTLPWVAAKLKVGDQEKVSDLEVETAPLDMLDADLLEVRIQGSSQLAGVEIGELRLPPEANVSLVVRNGRSIAVSPSLSLRPGDSLLVVTPRRVREETERRLRAVSERGRLASWREHPEQPPGTS